MKQLFFKCYIFRPSTYINIFLDIGGIVDLSKDLIKIIYFDKLTNDDGFSENVKNGVF